MYTPATICTPKVVVVDQHDSDVTRDAEWDAFVASHPEGYHEQTSMYGRIRERYGFACDRVIVRDGERIVGGAQLLSQTTPIGRYSRILRAPLAVDHDQEVLAEALRLLDEWAKKNRCVCVRVDTLPTQSAVRDALNAARFKPSMAWDGARKSYVIPIGNTDDETFAAMRQKTRYNMRLARRSGVEMQREDGSAIPDFYAMYLKTAEHQKFVPFPCEYFEQLWRLFAQSERAMLTFAHNRHGPLAGLLSVIVGNRVYASWMGVDRSRQEKNLQVAGLLFFVAARWGRECGCDLVDLQDDQPYKKMFANDQIQWPMPLRKYYGRARHLRRWFSEGTWRVPVARRRVKSFAHRLGLQPRMPY